MNIVQAKASVYEWNSHNSDEREIMFIALEIHLNCSALV